MFMMVDVHVPDSCYGRCPEAELGLVGVGGLVQVQVHLPSDALGLDELHQRRRRPPLWSRSQGLRAAVREGGGGSMQGEQH